MIDHEHVPSGDVAAAVQKVKKGKGLQTPPMSLIFKIRGLHDPSARMPPPVYGPVHDPRPRQVIFDAALREVLALLHLKDEWIWVMHLVQGCPAMDCESVKALTMDELSAFLIHLRALKVCVYWNDKDPNAMARYPQSMAMYPHAMWPDCAYIHDPPREYHGEILGRQVSSQCRHHLSPGVSRP